MLAYIAQNRGYQRGWIAHKYKEKFGTWPAWGATVEPIEPTPEVYSWVRQGEPFARPDILSGERKCHEHQPGVFRPSFLALRP